MGIIEEGPLEVEKGVVDWALEVTRRESNCLTTLKVLEMTRSKNVCSKGGAPEIVCESGMEQERGQEREMTIANAHFLPLQGHA